MVVKHCLHTVYTFIGTELCYRLLECDCSILRINTTTEEWRLLGCYAMWFLQEPHGVTSQKTPFFIVTAVKTSNLTTLLLFNKSMHNTEKF
jgi:hypothetical protein